MINHLIASFLISILTAGLDTHEEEIFSIIDSIRDKAIGYVNQVDEDAKEIIHQVEEIGH